MDIFENSLPFAKTTIENIYLETKNLSSSFYLAGKKNQAIAKGPNSLNLFIISSFSSALALVYSLIPCFIRVLRILAFKPLSLRFSSCLSNPFNVYPGMAKAAAPDLKNNPPKPFTTPLLKPFAPS